MMRIFPRIAGCPRLTKARAPGPEKSGSYEKRHSKFYDSRYFSRRATYRVKARHAMTGDEKDM